MTDPRQATATAGRAGYDTPIFAGAVRLPGLLHAMDCINNPTMHARKQMSYFRKYIDIVNEEVAPQASMTIMVHNSGHGTGKKPTQVFNTQLKMGNNNTPQLWFAFRQDSPAEYYADFTAEGWVADMD